MAHDSVIQLIPFAEEQYESPDLTLIKPGSLLHGNLFSERDLTKNSTAVTV